ncbi:MAG: S-layer homology domain-containing protein [Synergistaceae bacterium]|jgi:hypothetical protein|nr:S-layer homology domain-containing protein [Synergistaceae bacterium]
MKKFAIAIAAVILAAFAVPAFAATNPFMDVPASHWAYDAVAQLAARGVISGYPDGSYKGSQPSTRYEMASIIARALANVDLEKASKQDVEMMRRLIVEFKDELDALGVRVDSLDERVAVLETDIGGWSLAGQVRFDAKFGTTDAAGKTFYSGKNGDNEFDLNRYRIWIRKRVNETTTFMARLESSDNVNRNVVWRFYEITTKLPYDISLTVGRSNFDWENDLGLYIYNFSNDDALFGDIDANMFKFKKDWGLANLELVVARQSGRITPAVYDPNFQAVSNGDAAGSPNAANSIVDFPGGLESFLIAGLADFNINERVRAGVMLYYWMTDEEVKFANNTESDTDLLTLGVYAGFRFTPDVELKGVYYHQGLGDNWRAPISPTNPNPDDTASAWKVILDVKQEALKFTSVWLEYGHIDNNFAKMPAPYSGIGGGADLMFNRPEGLNESTTKVFGIAAGQQWNDKWRTFIRYFAADYDTQFIDDATNWTVGVAYRLNPAVEFELLYDYIDYGGFLAADGRTLYNAGPGGRDDDDHIIRLRTFVTF